MFPVKETRDHVGPSPYFIEDLRARWQFIPEQLVDSNLFLSPL